MKRKRITPTKKEQRSILEPHFQDEDKAREYLEQMRWPDGPVCPHCGLIGEAYKITVKEKTAEEIIEQIKGSRHFRNKDLGF